ncbi:MAG: type II secretion system F family protein [Pseudomonadota bacterium]
MSLDNAPALHPFEWTARSTDGRHRKGAMRAASKADVIAQLRAEGLFPIQVQPAGGVAKAVPKKARAAQKSADPSAVRKLTLAETDMFVGRLAKLTQMGITLDRALGFIEDAPQAKGKTLHIAQTASTLRRATREGTPFSDALRTHAGWDDVASLSLLRAAEVSGDLPKALHSVKQIFETRLALLRKLGTGLIYPAILIVVAMISVGLVMIAIIPEFRPIVEGRMDAIPFLGRAVFALSAWLETLWMLLLPAAALGIGIMFWLYRKGRLMPALMRVALWVPFSRALILRTGMVRALHVLGTLLTRGVVVSEAMQTLATGADGPLRAAFLGVSKRIEGGDPLWEALMETRLAPPDAIEMIRIGEEAGDLPAMILRSAEDLRAHADRDLERAMLLFQPALIVIVGLLIGVSLYALFSAISAVNQVSF